MENILKKIAELDEKLEAKKEFLKNFKEWAADSKIKAIILDNGTGTAKQFRITDTNVCVDLAILVNLDKISETLETEITTMQDESILLLQEKIKEIKK